jgi:integrase
VNDGYKRCKCRGEDGRELGARCPRLKRSNDSWNPSHGTWYAKVELPGAPDGSRLSLRAGGFATQEEMKDWFARALSLIAIPDPGPRGHAERAAILEIIRESRRTGAELPGYDETRRRYRAGVAFDPETTGEYLAGWLRRREAIGKPGANTLRGYRSHITRVFVPLLGDIPLDKLNGSHVEDCLTVRLPDGPSAATRQRMRATLRKALADAVRAGLIERNPAGGDAVQIQAGTRPKARVWTTAAEAAWRAGHEERAAKLTSGKARLADWLLLANRPGPVMVWLPAHAGAFLDAAQADRLYPLFYLMVFRGLRRSEACGLMWADTDLDDGIAVMHKGRVQVGWAVDEVAPKTDKSESAVSLDTATVAVLRAWRKAQLEERLAWGSGWTDTGHVFTREDGTPWHPATVTSRFERIAFGAGLPPVRLHDLRHGAASIAHKAGADMKTIQELLRHSSYKMTADTYTSVFAEVDREVAERMTSIVPRAAVAGSPSQTDGLPTVSRSRAGKRGFS